jgi:formylglycine-generating enzyme required for sulfatase activity
LAVFELLGCGNRVDAPLVPQNGGQRSLPPPPDCDLACESDLARLAGNAAGTIVQRWFLSYHTPDEALAERLKVAIERKDADSRVFFAPTHLRAGRSWSAQLAEEIAGADAFILLVGERGIGDWQVYEYDEALDKRVKSPDFPLIMLLLEGQAAPGLPFLRRHHWIVTRDPASENDVARLFDATAGGDSNPRDLWRYTCPYRGLAAMEEKDSGYFFGRKRETVDVLSALAGAVNRLPVLVGNSGVGKSSLAQAGVLAALKRQAWPTDVETPGPWPQVFRESRRWSFLTLRPGTAPLRALVDAFLDTWQFRATDPERVKMQNGWIELLQDGKVTLRDLIDATERRRKELDQPEPPGFFLYVDQGEELYLRSEERQRRRFSEILAEGQNDPRLRTLVSLRADFFGELQKDQPLHAVYRQIEVPPLHEAELREVISRPAALLSARFETDHLGEDIARRAAEESTRDAGALPLLSYLLDDMWQRMIERSDGVLRLPAQSIDLGQVLVQRADAFVASHPNSEDELRRILTLNLATVREDGEPTRRRAHRSEFSEAQWRLISELADHPNRLLVIATPESGEILAEVAHETIFRRWDKLRDWIAAEREFLAWRSGLEAARRTWQAAPDASKDAALLMGLAVTNASNWLSKRGADIPAADRQFITLSVKAARRRQMRVGALVGVLALAIVASLAGWLNQDALHAAWHRFTVTRPYMQSQVLPHVLSAAAERALKPGDSFKECAGECTEMVVIPAGSFAMGSPLTEKGASWTEEPQHDVTIGKPFAVSKYEVTFAEWDACTKYGDCPYISDSGFGRGRQPVIGVTWDDARHYAAWLSEMTGKTYRLLDEAEYEYAARAGTNSPYPWGDEIGKARTDCYDCGTQWDNRTPAPVGSFAANRFGLYDMVGNVWEWTQDCWHDDYGGAPANGSAWTTGGDCRRRVVRGGSYVSYSATVRCASRWGYPIGGRFDSVGFRVARTLER